MAQKIEMVEMSRKLADHLKGFALLQGYCQEQFNKEATVVVEYSTAREIPDLETTPWIMIYNASKEEGMQKTAKYQCDFAIGVANDLDDRYLVTDSGALVLQAYKHTSDIVDIIQNALNTYRERYIPPNVFAVNFTGEVDQGGRLWTAIVHCEWEIDQVLGYNNGFDF
ncbi:MAG: hypothetical protein IKL58_00095 [Phascolarctobacterium sp.]|nr:hypothetical protein [Phascolarctobacterium sp.]